MCMDASERDLYAHQPSLSQPSHPQDFQPYASPSPHMSLSYYECYIYDRFCFIYSHISSEPWYVERGFRSDLS